MPRENRHAPAPAPIWEEIGEPIRPIAFGDADDDMPQLAPAQVFRVRDPVVRPPNAAEIAAMLGQQPQRRPDHIDLNKNVGPELFVVEGAKDTRRKCRICGRYIQDVKCLTWLHDIANICVACATQNGISWPSFLYKDPVERSDGTGNTIGIELECNPTLDTIMRARDMGWGIKPDGSLRGLSMEFVSPILRESNAEKFVRSTFRSIDDAVVYNRCGYHVWIGAKDIAWNGLANIIRYCCMHQKHFEHIVSPSRSLSKKSDGSGRPVELPKEFLIPCHNRDEVLMLMYGDGELYHTEKNGKKVCLMRKSKRCNDRRDDDHPDVKTMYPDGHASRYHWINFHGYWHRRAIEIRLHQGTVDPEKIVNWATLWNHLLHEIAQLHPSKLHKFKPSALMPKWLKDYYTARAKFYSEMPKAKYIEDMKGINIIGATK